MGATEGGDQETQREGWATMHEALRSIVAQSWLVSGSQRKLLTVAGAAEEDNEYHLTSHLTCLFLMGNRRDRHQNRGAL